VTLNHRWTGLIARRRGMWTALTSIPIFGRHDLRLSVRQRQEEEPCAHKKARCHRAAPN
jgi:hypothetical protein